MPWSNNHLPKYRKHRASGQAVVTLSGQDFYLGPHGTKASKLEYDRLIGEWLQDGRLLHLKELPLHSLYVNGTNVTDVGVEELQNELPDCMISH